jgi:predicted Zn finger-like uncharacterized protein
MFVDGDGRHLTEKRVFYGPYRLKMPFLIKSRPLLNDIQLVYFIYRCKKMIATCPHCQSGFYISSEMAGAVIKCSKCKKEVRAPDRRGCVPGPLTDDGIPAALLAETRAETEEHLKNETEARFELEKQIKSHLEAKTKAELQAQIDARARQEAEERLQKEISARAEIEARLLTETDARKKAEETAVAEKQAREEFEEKFKTETGLEANVQVEAISRELDEIKAKLKEAQDALTEAQTHAAKEAETKTQLEQQLQAQTEATVRAESQAKAEAIAKKKYQSQTESETSLRIKLEQELEETKSRIKDIEIAARSRKPINLTKGLVRLAFILSLVAAVVGGYIAYTNGYVINSHYDRPMRLPLFSKAVYLPVNLIAISIGSYLAAWVVVLAPLFVIRGFGRSSSAKAKVIAQSGPIFEETVAIGKDKTWRSS